MPTMRLPVELTDPEKVNVLGEMSDVVTAIEAAKADKKIAMDGHNKKIASLEAKLHSINESIKSSTVDRDVEIEIEKFPLAGKAKIWRVDRTPKEFVKEVSLDPEEAQLLIKGSVVDGGASGKVTNMADHVPTEEQVVAGTPEEAEELRAARIAAEREERVGSLAAELSEKVTVDPVDVDGVGKFQARLPFADADGNRCLEETADTADAAKMAVSRAMAENIIAAEEQSKAAGAAAARVADRIERIVAVVRESIVLEERGADLVAIFRGEVECLPGRDSFSGEAKPTAQEAIDDLITGIRKLLEDRKEWMMVAEASAENERQAEIAKLAGEQASDRAATTKATLKVPKGARSRRTKAAGGAAAVEKADEKPADAPALPEAVPGASSDPPVDTTTGPDEAF
jgi:hypothetical protein